MKRRRVLAILGSTTPLAGCTSTGTETSSDIEPETASLDATETPTQTRVPTTTSGISSETLLPAAESGWSLERTEEEDWDHMGGVDGKHGYYVSPEGVPYEVVVMAVKEDLDAERIARGWKCYPGWQLTLAYRGFAVAAGSGTSQETGTPDVPKMTRTPARNSGDGARELLGFSPRLNSEDVSKREIESC